MSTNKRKEAAALFELIDKSTLKVPKHAGALKIPSWWSSKTNPPPVAPPVPADEFPSPATPSPSPAARNGSAAETAAPAAAPGTPVAQHRLFDPPPAGATPALSPSIRPPAPASSGQPTVRVLSAVPAKAPPVGSATPESAQPAAAVTPPRAAEPAVKKTEPATRRVFAPKTFDPASLTRRHGGTGQGRRLVARLPLWAMVGGAAGVIFLVVLILFLVLHSHRKPVAAAAGGVDLGSSRAGTFALQNSSSQAPTPGDTQAPTSLLPENNAAAGAASPADAAEPGKVFGPGTVDRDPKLFYIVIASTPSTEIAQRDAKFLADRGVDVSIEKRTSPSGRSMLFTLISVQGFPTLTEAEAYKKKIVLIGHQHPDFAKSRKVWDDAFASRVRSTVSAGR